MCLHVNHQATDKLFNSGKEFVIGYKVVVKSLFNGALRSTFFEHEWLPGVNKSDTRRRYGPAKGPHIDNAIHVYVSRKVAIEKYLVERNSHYRVLPVKCYIKDLIGVQLGCTNRPEEMAFRKVYLSKQAYANALK